MIRVIWLAALAAVIGCGPSSALVRCEEGLCGDEAPSLTFDEPRAGTLVPGDTLRIQGWVTDDEGAVSLELSLNAGKTWSKVPLRSERFDAKVALPVLDGAPLELILRATDSRQHVTRAGVKVRVDNVAPVVTVEVPAVVNAAAAEVKGAASDGSGLASLSVNTGEGEVAIEGFPYAWPGSADDGVPRQVTVTAIDLAGNRTVVSREVMVDVVPPVLSIAVPRDQAILGQAFFANGRVEGTARGVAKVQVSFGAAAPLDVHVIGGAWSVAWVPPPTLDFVAQGIDVLAIDAAGNVARESRAVMVDVVAPVLTVVSPLSGARLNAASFPGGDGVEVKVAVTDGDPQTSVNGGAPLTVLTSLLDNPKAYAVALTARDRAGNSAAAAVAFTVDRVAPSVISRVPSVESRNAAAVASVEFSEDVTGGPGLMISGGSGSWTTGRHFEVTGLEADAVYASTLGALVDAFGNPVAAAAPVRFHTAPKLPVTGVLGNDVWQFEAAADADGVVTLLTRSASTPATYRWTRVNSKTGALEDLVAPMVGFDLTDVAVYGEAQVLPDLSARRVSAATTVRAGPFVERRALSVEDGAPVVVTQGMVGVVPRAAFASEGPGLAGIGFLKWSGGTSSYARGGMVEVGLGLDSPTAMGFAASRWEVISARNGVFQRRAFGCSTVLGSTSCGPGALQQWTDVGVDASASFAVSDACTVALYDTSTGVRRQRLDASCVGRDCGVSLQADLPQVEQLRVARDAEGGFVAAKRVPGGGVKLMRMACSGTFIEVPGGTVAVPLGAAFEPVALGSKAALLYVDTGFTLKLFAP